MYIKLLVCVCSHTLFQRHSATLLLWWRQCAVFWLSGKVHRNTGHKSSLLHSM